MNSPIIVEDQDGGYILARYVGFIDEGGKRFHIYKYKEYHHTLESAVKCATKDSNQISKL